MLKSEKVSKCFVQDCNLVYFMMVLTRAALEKLNKEKLISPFPENDDKLNSKMANLAEVKKTYKRMESQLEISKKITNTLEKRISSLEKQFGETNNILGVNV